MKRLDRDAQTPLVTVVVPTFNRATLLPRAVRSLMGQTYEAVEVVVVDDGSTDDTRAILTRLAAVHPERLTWESKPNGGCASARNHGLRLARGEFLAFLDSDDEWMPEAAGSLAAALVSTGADIVYSPAIEVEPDGREWINQPVAAGAPDSFALAHFMSTNLRNGAFMFRRHVLTSVGQLNEALRHNEDSDFVQRIAIAHRATYSSTPTVRVYHHDANKSRDRVGITRALLDSAVEMQRNHPDFVEALGAAGGERFRQLKIDHATELTRAERYAEAAAFLRHERLGAPLSLRLALLAHSQLPLRLSGRLVRAAHRLARRVAGP